MVFEQSFIMVNRNFLSLGSWEDFNLQNILGFKLFNDNLVVKARSAMKKHSKVRFISYSIYKYTKTLSPQLVPTQPKT